MYKIEDFAPQRQPLPNSAWVCIDGLGHNNTVGTWCHAMGTFYNRKCLCILPHFDLQSLFSGVSLKKAMEKLLSALDLSNRQN